jgi:hypothetical protein
VFIGTDEKDISETNLSAFELEEMKNLISEIEIKTLVIEFYDILVSEEI